MVRLSGGGGRLVGRLRQRSRLPSPAKCSSRSASSCRRVRSELRRGLARGGVVAGQLLQRQIFTYTWPVAAPGHGRVQEGAEAEGWGIGFAGRAREGEGRRGREAKAWEEVLRCGVRIGRCGAVRREILRHASAEARTTQKCPEAFVPGPSSAAELYIGPDGYGTKAEVTWAGARGSPSNTRHLRAARMWVPAGLRHCRSASTWLTWRACVDLGGGGALADRHRRRSACCARTRSACGGSVPEFRCSSVRAGVPSCAMRRPQDRSLFEPGQCRHNMWTRVSTGGQQSCDHAAWRWRRRPWIAAGPVTWESRPMRVGGWGGRDRAMIVKLREF